MRPSSARISGVALPFLAFVSSVVAQTPGPYQNQGCFSSSSGMTSIGSYMYQSPGYCSDQCKSQGKAVAATTKGKDCWCGDKLPPASSKTSDSSCNVPCTGYGSDSCGGSSTWSVYLTGLDDNPGSVSGSNSNANSNQNSNSKSSSNDDTDSNSDSSDDDDSASSSTISSTSSTTPTPTPAPASTTTKKEKAAASVVTHASTIVVTAPGQSQARTTVITTTQTPDSNDDGGSRPNVAGIAAGVVVGVVAVAAIAGGLFFFLRNRKRKALEEEYQRNAAASNYNTLKPATSSAGSTSDSRLEPSVMMQRRQSDGSIADNQDYSRRILKVTNPDGS